MNRPSLTGNQRAPWSRERNKPPQALGSCASAGMEHEKAKANASWWRRRVDTSGVVRQGEEAGAADSSPRRAPVTMALRLAGFLPWRKRDLGHSGAVQS